MRSNQGTVVCIDSREGVTQGDPLAMLGYSIAIMPMVRQLKHSFPNIMSIWYADNAGGMGPFEDIKIILKH